MGSNVLLEHVFKQLHKPLVFYAYKFVGDEDIAKDLVQDAFLNIIRIGNYEALENLKTFLYKCVRNNCINHLNHRAVESAHHENESKIVTREIEYYNAHQAIVERELKDKLLIAIEGLPDIYKTPLKLSRFENLKNTEIAENLNLPVRTVETRIYRALSILRDKLDKNMFQLFMLLLPKTNPN
ncbi:RNA polymerase sigma-70 factor [Maribellus luteus]|uniref:RNA polymerase sigma-70 factor n=1 Tax=Maribellus luteus TaxID=2305463 RepID=UPI00138FFA63|nr:RNA polymerase sigma-70 factor [Maribellus luteus]